MSLASARSRVFSSAAVGIVALALSLPAACAALHHRGSAAPVAHRGRGLVVAVNAEKHRVKIDHEAIEGYMEAMTMWFDVKDPKLLDGLAPNDKIEFVVTEEDAADVVTEIKKID